jgi:hypothetical protein
MEQGARKFRIADRELRIGARVKSAEHAAGAKSEEQTVKCRSDDYHVGAGSAIGSGRIRPAADPVPAPGENQQHEGDGIADCELWVAGRGMKQREERVSDFRMRIAA